MFLRFFNFFFEKDLKNLKFENIIKMSAIESMKSYTYSKLV